MLGITEMKEDIQDLQIKMSHSVTESELNELRLKVNNLENSLKTFDAKLERLIQMPKLQELIKEYEKLVPKANRVFSISETKPAFVGCEEYYNYWYTDSSVSVTHYTIPEFEQYLATLHREKVNAKRNNRTKR